jgi:hypothetical protein
MISRMVRSYAFLVVFMVLQYQNIYTYEKLAFQTDCYIIAFGWDKPHSFNRKFGE